MQFKAAPALLVACLLALASSPAASSAQAPYEPNDELSNAAGPLVLGQTYTATIEALNDRDFFYFYVASTDSVQSVLTVENLGGSNQFSEIDARIIDPLGTYVGGDFVYLKSGESKTSAVALKAGKYFVEVTAREAPGDSYRLTTGGADGAFAGYSTIAARCAAATASVKRLRAGLGRAQTKLQRAVSRLRRSRYASREALRAARALHTRAKTRVAAKRRALRAAAKAQRPWCFIPQ